MAMYYRSFGPRDLFAEMDRLQREMLQSFDPNPSIRGLTRGYPALNVGGTPRTVVIYVFAPGLDPAGIDLQVEKNLLSISGERNAGEIPEKATVHINERFAGKFRRMVNLPDDIDSNVVEAKYQNGVLQVRIQRKEETQPRRISIQ